MASPRQRFVSFLAKHDPAEVEALVLLLDRHSVGQVRKIATLLESTSTALDPDGAIDFAKAAADARPKRPNAQLLKR